MPGLRRDEVLGLTSPDVRSGAMESTDGGSFSELGMATDDSERWGAILHQHQATLSPLKRSIYLCDLVFSHGQQQPATARPSFASRGQRFESPQLHFKDRFRTGSPACFGRRTGAPAIGLPPYRLSAFARRRANSQSGALSVAEERRRVVISPRARDRSRARASRSFLDVRGASRLRTLRAPSS